MGVPLSEAPPQRAAVRTYGTGVQVPKAAELVADSLRRQIVRGRIADGEYLPTEATLMQQFAVSRPTLREAMRILEVEGMVTLRRGARGGAVAHRMEGALVARYAALLLESRGATLRDVYAAQAIFEPACVEQLATARSDNLVKRLREMLAAEASGAGAGAEFEARVRFHSQLITLSGNQTLTLLSELIEDVLLAAGAVEPIGVDEPEAFEEHREVVDLIEAGDGPGAVASWARHVHKATQRNMSAFGDVPLAELLDRTRRQKPGSA